MEVPAAERSALLEVAASIGTPTYVYNLGTIARKCSELKAAVAGDSDCKTQLLYAMKANSNRDVVETVVAAGFGLECVSAGEVAFAIRARAPVILYTSNNCDDAE